MNRAAASPQIRHDEHGREMYEPDGVELTKFVVSNRFVDIIQGPLGSGKTRALCMRVMRHAQEQAPSPIDALRKSRWAIVRNTFPDLKRTTIRTWLDCFPEDIYGRFFWGQPPAHKIRFGDVRLEVDFLALDKPDDIRKLRSGEYTGIAFNEVQYSEKELIDEATSRVGRYPKMADGGPSWTGVIADANAPDEDHWLAVMTGQVDFPEGMTEDERAELRWPAEWGFYMQPPALLEKFGPDGKSIVGYTINPMAENLKWLPSNYYERQLPGKSRAWINSRLMNRVALVVEGSPVWPMFRVETHVTGEVLRPVPGHDVYVGLDFGRSPAAVFLQPINNRVLVQYEIIGQGEGAVSFAPKVKRFLTKHYPGFRVRLFGDPKGRDKGQTDDRTAYDVFAANGLPVEAPPLLKQNMIETRVQAVAHLLGELYDGTPRFVLSPMCRTLKVGMAGRYFNEKDEDGILKPTKKRYSHICDALQYVVLGLGEGRRMIGLTPGHELCAVKYAKPRGSRRRVS